jgi:starch synthase
MRVVFVSSEVAPFSKTGGLGDVAGALPWALVELGCEVVLITPYYDQAARNVERQRILNPLRRLQVLDPQYSLASGTALLTTECVGVQLVFVEHEYFSERMGLYVDEVGRDYSDNFERFALFCQAALAYCRAEDPQPDILHCHDWQTALIPALLKASPAGEGISARTVLTIHNLAYQGLFPAEKLGLLELDPTAYSIDAFEYYGQANLLKGGIAYSDAFTTVSPTYAEEIQTPDQGMGLDGFIRSQSAKLSGIVNGIDTDIYDPAHGGTMLGAGLGYKGFTSEYTGGKSDCKSALQREFGLPERPEALLLGMITRFDPQKGVGLLIEALPLLQDLDWQLILLGSGTAEIELAAAGLPALYPRRSAVSIGFDPGLALRIYAGADALLMPSFYEPCGLNQMYAQRFGTLPIVRATGGLRDTVTNASEETLADGTASGFSFEPFTPEALAEAIRRAWALFNDWDSWNLLSRSVMRIDNSWAASARKYLALYESLLGAGQPGQEARHA